MPVPHALSRLTHSCKKCSYEENAVFPPFFRNKSSGSEKMKNLHPRRLRQSFQAQLIKYLSPLTGPWPEGPLRASEERAPWDSWLWSQTPTDPTSQPLSSVLDSNTPETEPETHWFDRRPGRWSTNFLTGQGKQTFAKIKSPPTRKEQKTAVLTHCWPFAHSPGIHNVLQL